MNHKTCTEYTLCTLFIVYNDQPTFDHLQLERYPKDRGSVLLRWFSHTARTEFLPTYVLDLEIKTVFFLNLKY